MRDSIFDENNILIARIQDQKRLCDTKNRITSSVFLNSSEQAIVSKNIDLNRSMFFGAIPNAERKIIIFYPEKITKELAMKTIMLDNMNIRITYLL